MSDKSGPFLHRNEFFSIPFDKFGPFLMWILMPFKTIALDTMRDLSIVQLYASLDIIVPFYKISGLLKEPVRKLFV